MCLHKQQKYVIYQFYANKKYIKAAELLTDVITKHAKMHGQNVHDLCMSYINILSMHKYVI